MWGAGYRQRMMVVAAAALLAACAPPIMETAPEAPVQVTPSPPLVQPSPTLETPAKRTEGGTRREAIMPAAPRPVILPTPEPTPDLGWRPPPYPAPWAIQPYDHFYFGRPIPSGEVNWPNPRYRYGSTLLGTEKIHAGVDMGASRGAPVIAAGDGEVVWVGYGLYRGWEDFTDPYGLAIAIRHDFGYQGRELYTVYAHLASASVWPGQRVKKGEVIGEVGETGHASGSHLHFEVRLGGNRYFDTRNPELWMVPPEGWGVLAGRVENTFGRPLQEYLIQIRSLDTGKRWDVWTYAREDTIHPDDYYNENFVISDLPAGPYEIQINFAGRAYTAQFWLEPGIVNFIEFHGRNGFDVEPAAESQNLSHPPHGTSPSD